MVRVTCESTAGITLEQVKASDLFQRWDEARDPGWELTDFKVVWGAARPDGQVRMMFAKVGAYDPAGYKHWVGALLRGGTVEMLALLITPDSEKFLVMVEQPRTAVGKQVLSLPAGMTDGQDPLAAMLRELDEEVAEGLRWTPALDLMELLFGHPVTTYVTPGGSDESRHFYATSAPVSREQIKQLHDRQSGAIDEGERITVRLVRLSEAKQYVGDHQPISEATAFGLLLFEDAVRRGLIPWMSR